MYSKLKDYKLLKFVLFPLNIMSLINLISSEWYNSFFMVLISILNILEYNCPYQEIVKLRTN